MKIKQHDFSDCGAACLASVAAYYKLYIPLPRIRQYAGTDKRGTTALGIVEAASAMGFESKGVKGVDESLDSIPIPAIAHVIIDSRIHHYVIVGAVNKKFIRVMDPAEGVWIKYVRADFLAIWSGVLILLIPSTDFITRSEKEALSIRFWQLLKPHRAVMTQALFGAFLFTLLGLTTSIYVQKIVDVILVDSNKKLLHLLSAGMIVLLSFQTFLGYYKSFFAIKTGQQIDTKLILGYYRHLLHLPQKFFDTMRVGEIISRVGDAVKIRAFINDVALGLMVNVFILVTSLSLMFFYYWRLAALMLAVIPIYSLLFYFSDRINKVWQRKLMEENAAMESVLVESLNSSGTLKQLQLEKFFTDRFEKRFIKLLHSIYLTSNRSLEIGTATDFFTRLFTIIILWVGSVSVIDREMTPGQLLSFYALIAYFTGPAAALVNVNRNIREALIAADRLYEIIDLETEDDHRTSAAKIALPLNSDIHFDNVGFRYNNRDVLLDNLNFTIPGGSFTAIMGESGMGKSTILHLMQKLYPVKKGVIRIGGLNIKDIDSAMLRNAVGVVPQKVELFTGSILENITIGINEPDLNRVQEICQRIGLASLLDSLLNGIHTMVEEQGQNLSGGQRQKIAIARALYRDPQILILDEPTASMDACSEEKIIESLKRFQAKGKTVIIVTHKVATIVNADKILVLKNSQIIQEGNHKELLNRTGYYQNLWLEHSTGSYHSPH